MMDISAKKFKEQEIQDSFWRLYNVNFKFVMNLFEIKVMIVFEYYSMDSILCDLCLSPLPTELGQ